MIKSGLLRWAKSLPIAAALALPGISQATDLTYFRTIYDTDFVSVGIGGMRGYGDGDLALSGVTGTVTQAYLYWHGPSNASAANAPTANANVSFAGSPVVGTFLGISSDNCWGFANSLAYRADVTSLVTGNGTFSLDDFRKSASGIDINGVSLIVFFDDGDATNNRDVVMFNGNDSNIENPYDANGWNITLAGIDYSDGDASAQFHVSDGQNFLDDAVIANGTAIASAGAVFQGDSVQTAHPGNTTGGLLWDIKDFSITSLLSPGLNNVNITSGLNSDCLSCVLIAIDLPAGAAPPDPSVPEPGAIGMLGLTLVGLWAVRRRRQQG